MDAPTDCDTWTLDYACLREIGGLAPGDGALTLLLRARGWMAAGLQACSLHADLVEHLDAGDLILLPDSAGPLARALYRHWGLPLLHALDVPIPERVGGGWMLVGAGAVDVYLIEGSPDDLDPYASRQGPPGLGAIQDPARVLAEVVVWEARRARYKRLCTAYRAECETVGRHLSEADLPDMANAEDMFLAAEWTVGAYP